MYTGPLAGFDTETTGVKVHEDGTRVVTCALIMQDSSESEHKIIEWMMDPEIEIPTGASDVHGITTERARVEGMNYVAGLQKIADVMSYLITNRIPTTAYNGGFDVTLLRVEFLARDIDFDDNLWNDLLMVDPLVMDKRIDTFRKGKRTLGVVSGLYGYDLSNAHEATADVLATMHVARRIIQPFVASLEKEFDHKVGGFTDLMPIQAEMYRRQATSLEKHFRKTDPNITINKSWPFQDPEG